MYSITIIENKTAAVSKEFWSADTDNEKYFNVNLMEKLCVFDHFCVINKNVLFWIFLVISLSTLH